VSMYWYTICFYKKLAEHGFSASFLFKKIVK
jgi:hypothetical protein